MAVKTKEDATLALGRVADDKRFYCSDGCIYGSLSEMAGCLEHIDAGAFSHHVTSLNNDFANWVRDIIHDDKLASDLMKAANAADAARIVRYRIHWLQTKAHH